MTGSPKGPGGGEWCQHLHRFLAAQITSRRPKTKASTWPLSKNEFNIVILAENSPVFRSSSLFRKLKQLDHNLEQGTLNKVWIENRWSLSPPTSNDGHHAITTITDFDSEKSSTFWFLNQILKFKFLKGAGLGDDFLAASADQQWEN